MSIGYIDILYSGQISGTTISGTNIIVSTITVSNIISTGSTSNSFVSLSASSFSASTIQSSGLGGGGTQMVIVDNAGVFSKQSIPSAGQSTIIRDGLNTYTAGTTADYTVNISALTINTLIASGNSIFTGTLSGGSSFSASTIYSGSTNLYSIFAGIGSVGGGTSTSVQPGLNTYTGGTSTSPTVNVSALTINTLTASGNSVFTGMLSGGSSFSANTLYSGSTNLNSIFSQIGHTHQFSAILNTAHTHSVSEIANLSSLLDTKLNLSGGTMTGGLTTTALSASTISGGTLYSGSTNLYSIFAPIGTGGSGESNTASNLGSGTGIFAQKSGVDLQFKGLSAGTNITLNSNSDTIIISSTGSNSIITGITQVNFGFATGGEGMYATTAVTNSNITQNSIIYFRLSASTDHLDIEDSLLENISLKESDIVDGVGFNINAYSDSSTWGEYNIFYRITN